MNASIVVRPATVCRLTTLAGVACCAGLLSACASGPSPDRGQQLGSAVTAPLSDLNLVRADIPDALARAARAPYALPADASCEALAAEIQGLDAVLGADLDAPQTATNPSLLERGGSAAGDAAVGAVRNTAEGVIPFRGWVRKLTGAEKYAREVAAAITAGGVRRGFLKGLRAGRTCPPAAAAAAPGASR